MYKIYDTGMMYFPLNMLQTIGMSYSPRNKNPLCQELAGLYAVCLPPSQPHLAVDALAHRCSQNDNFSLLIIICYFAKN
jgi:hypothetical protein